MSTKKQGARALVAVGATAMMLGATAPTALAQSNFVPDPNRGTASQQGTFTNYPNPIDNPVVAEEACETGLDFTLVYDTSDSMSSSDITKARNAGKSFVDALVTASPNSRVGVTTFASTSPSNKNTPNQDRLPVNVGAGTIKTKLDTITRTNPGNASKTSYEAAFKALNDSPQGGGDVVVFMTDGVNTHSSTGGTNIISGRSLNSALTRGVSWDHPYVNQANTLKADGTRIIYVGVGISDYNPNKTVVDPFTFVTGPGGVEGQDYFGLDNFDALSSALTDIVSDTCAVAEGSIEDVSRASTTHGPVTVQGRGLGDLDWSTLRFTEEGKPLGSTVSADGQTVTVPGEGVWTVEGRGMKFTPEDGYDFGENPTPVSWTVSVTDGDPLDPAKASVSYAGDVSEAGIEDVTMNSTTCTPVTLDPIAIGDVDLSTMTYTGELFMDGEPVPEADMPEVAVSDDARTLTIADQGTWTIDGDQLIFTPEEGFDCSVTPFSVGFGALTEDGDSVFAKASVTFNEETTPIPEPTTPITEPTTPTAPTTEPTKPTKPTTPTATVPPTITDAPWPTPVHPGFSDQGGLVSPSYAQQVDGGYSISAEEEVGPKVDTGGAVNDSFWAKVKSIFI